MKTIATYFEDINFKNQKELLELWERSWKNKGFETIVLSEKDARKSPFFEEFSLAMKKIHRSVMGVNLGRYGLSCYLRWLAYSTLPTKRLYVSDYDIININFNGFNDNGNKTSLELFCAMCPCFAAGTPSQFLSLCELFVEKSRGNIEELKKKNFVHYHDQEFFWGNFNDNDLDKEIQIQDLSIKINKMQPGIAGFYDPHGKIQNLPGQKNTFATPYRVIHFAHHNIGLIKEHYPQYKNVCSEKLRGDMIKKAINESLIK